MCKSSQLKCYSNVLNENPLLNNYAKISFVKQPISLKIQMYLNIKFFELKLE